jgi:hypothetical protein
MAARNRFFLAFLIGCALWSVALITGRLVGFDIRRHHFESAGIAYGTAMLLLVGANWLHLSQQPSSRGHIGTPIVALLLAAFAVGNYAWTLRLGLLSDDFVLSAWARQADFVPSDWEFVRPLPLLFWKLIDAVFADRFGLGIHLFSVALHAANAMLVYCLARRVTKQQTPAVIAAALFVSFPASVEAVAWGAGVFDLSMVAGVLGFVTLTLRMDIERQRSPILIGAATIVFAAALASKESAVVAPALLVVSLLGEGDLKRQRLGWTVAGVALGCALLYSWWRVGHSGFASSAGITRFYLKELVVRPFRALALPWHEVLVPAQIWFAAVSGGLAFLAFTAALAAGIRAGYALVRPLAMGLLWVVVAVVPLHGAFHVGPDLQGSRYLYLPAVGWALALGCAVSLALEAFERWRYAVLVVVAVVVAVGSSAIQWHAASWQRAALVRDKALESATILARAQNCAAIRARQTPDNVQGAYVFREGLRFALGGASQAADQVRCEICWSGNEFVICASR